MFADFHQNKVFLKILQYSQEKLVSESVIKKVAALEARKSSGMTSIISSLWKPASFPVHIAKFLRAAFSRLVLTKRRKAYVTTIGRLATV